MSFVIGKSCLVRGRSSQKLGEMLSKHPRLPEKFPDPSSLSPNYRKILRFLELRASENGGDTKASDEKIAKFLNISLKTVSRGMKRLEDMRYILRMTTQHMGARKGCSSRNQFYSLRVIRCNRVFMMSGTEVRTQRELGWKTDVAHRVAYPVPMPEKFIARREILWYSDRAEYVFRREATESDLFENNIKDVDFEEVQHMVRELKDYDHDEGKEILGYKRKEW